MLNRFVVVSFIALVACSGPTKSAPTSPVVQPKPTAVATKATLEPTAYGKQLDRYIASLGQDLGDAHKFTGFVFVAQGDRVIYERPWQFADRGAKRVADRDTSFRIGSVTKQFTAVAILQLQEKGLLSVHDTIGKHLPSYPAVGAKLTIHQLLSHTSGLPNYTNDAALMKKSGVEISVPDLMATFSNKQLEFVPGSKFSYSNSGYVVLGAIIEAAAKTSYHDYVRDHVFGPAGLTRTLYGDARGADNRARGYQTDKHDKLVPSDKMAMSMAYAAGGVRSSAADLWRWHKAIETDKLLKPASRKQMYTPVKKHYGYGWIIRDVEGKRIIAHDGGIPGFSTSYMRLINDDVTVVVWSNNLGVDAGGVGRAAVRLAMGKKVEPERHTAIDPALAKRIAGSYVMAAESRVSLTKLAGATMADSVQIIDIEFVGTALMSKPIGQPPIRLEHTQGLVFEIKRVRATLTFLEDKPGGTITGMSLAQGNLTFQFTRDAKAAAAIKAKRGATK